MVLFRPKLRVGQIAVKTSGRINDSQKPSLKSAPHCIKREIMIANSLGQQDGCNPVEIFSPELSV